MNRLLLLVTACMLGACGQSSDVQDSMSDSEESDAESQRLNAWFETKFEEQLQFSPLQLTALGRKDAYDQIDDFSESEEERQLEWLRQSVIEMERDFDYRQLDEETRLSYDLWKYEYEIALDGQAFRNHGYVFEQMRSLQSLLPNFLINYHQAARRYRDGIRSAH